MRVSPEGGYSGIVVKIQDDVPDDLCKTILSNLEVLNLFCCFDYFGDKATDD